VRFEASPPAAAPAAAPPPELSRTEPSYSPDATMTGGAQRHEPEIDFDEPPAMRGSTAPRREPTLGPKVEPAAWSKPASVRAAPPPEEAPAGWSKPASAPPAPTHEEAPATAAKPASGHAAPTTEAPPAAAAAQRPAKKIIAVRVNATAPARLEGTQLLECLRAEGLQYGRYGIFHRLHSDGRPIFSVANLREPGTFDLDAMAGTGYPGVAIFTVLPAPLPAAEAFDQLLFTARAIAAQLNGTLADDRGGPLTAHRIVRLREEIVDFERQRSSDATG